MTRWLQAGTGWCSRHHWRPPASQTSVTGKARPPLGVPKRTWPDPIPELPGKNNYRIHPATILDDELLAKSTGSEISIQYLWTSGCGVLVSPFNFVVSLMTKGANLAFDTNQTQPHRSISTDKTIISSRPTVIIDSYQVFHRRPIFLSNRNCCLCGVTSNLQQGN
jgi:hypothetical protein